MKNTDSVVLELTSTINRTNEFEIPLIKAYLTMDELVVVVVGFGFSFFLLLIILAPLGFANFAMILAIIPAIYLLKFMSAVRKNQKEKNYLFDFWYRVGAKHGRGLIKCKGKIGRKAKGFGFTYENISIGMTPVDGPSPFLTSKSNGKPKPGMIMRRDTQWRRLMPPGSHVNNPWIRIPLLIPLTSRRTLHVDPRSLLDEMPTKRKGKFTDNSDVAKVPSVGFPAPAWFHPVDGNRGGSLGYEEVLRPKIAFALLNDNPESITHFTGENRHG